MKGLLKTWGLCCLLCCILHSVAKADFTVDIGAAETLYTRGDYREAIAKLHEINGVINPIPKVATLDKQTRARVFFDLGCCYLSAGASDQASQAFQTAFYLAPHIQKGFFKNASPGTHWQNLQNQKEQERRLTTSRVHAALRSLAIPGWGQRYRGYEKKALIFGGTTVAVAGYWLVKYLSFRSAQDKYRATVRADVIDSNREDGNGIYSEFEARYRTANNRARQVNIALGLLGSIWGLSILDSVVWGPNQVQVSVQF